MRIWLMAMLLILAAGGLAAEPARFDAAASAITAEGRPPHPLVLDLAFGRKLAYRTLILGAPPRLVLDVEDADFGDTDPATLTGAGLVAALRWGEIAPGTGRLVAELPGPMRLASAATDTAGRLRLTLEPVAPQEFAPDGSGAALPQLWRLPQPATVAPGGPRRPGPLRVTLDPGHGGFDPGAQAGGVNEADLMLIVADGIAAALRDGGAEVTLTRTADSFVPLERRMTVARAAGADLLISLHADALPAGAAAGAAVFVWNNAADDRAARELALRHDRDDLLAGLDLAGADDQVADVLMDLARLDAQPRAENMARFMVSRLALRSLAIHKQPVKGAAFSVLKSPDIPSILIETGFLTDAQDRANLIDPLWRARLAEAVSDAVLSWAEDDAARAPLLRH